MRLFVSEFACSGGSAEGPASALVAEGRAMLLAVLESATGINGLEVLTTWDERLGSFPETDANATIFTVGSPGEEADVFVSCCRQSDAVLIIAPEIDSHLESRLRLAESLNVKVLNCNCDTIHQLADKVETRQLLEAADIPTPRIEPIDRRGCTLPFPVVVKPRCGAGCQQTHLFMEAAEFNDWLASARDIDDLILQSHVDGFASSVAVIYGEHQTTVLPAGEQIIGLESDCALRYFGGRISTGLNDPRRAIQSRIDQIAARLPEHIPGLRGWVGIDFVIPREEAHRPVVVDINPRLTTTYGAYSKLCAAPVPLLQRLLHPDDDHPNFTLPRNQTIEFDLEGKLTSTRHL